MFGAVFTLMVLPWLDRHPVRSARYRPIFSKLFWVLVINIITLGWIGAKPPEGAYLWIGRAATA
jgi:ubiquinol-cytochrome c reductase cytochrome b subunit